MMNAKAIDIFVSRDNTIDINWKDRDRNAVDMTGYTLSGEITWSGGSLDIDSMLSYVNQSSGQMRLSIPSASAADIPLGAASKLSLTGTTGGNGIPILSDHPVFAS